MRPDGGGCWRWGIGRRAGSIEGIVNGGNGNTMRGGGPQCMLMGYIDDATGKVFGRFYNYEGTIPAMDSFKRYIRKRGLPLKVYWDGHSTYKSTAKPTIQDELNNVEPSSQFERVLKELGVGVIHAHSPQAKGRIERLFGRLQDRLAIGILESLGC